MIAWSLGVLLDWVDLMAYINAQICCPPSAGSWCNHPLPVAVVAGGLCPCAAFSECKCYRCFPRGLKRWAQKSESNRSTEACVVIDKKSGGFPPNHRVHNVQPHEHWIVFCSLIPACLYDSDLVPKISHKKYTSREMFLLKYIFLSLSYKNSRILFCEECCLFPGSFIMAGAYREREILK